jgi:hypothetical protein
MEGGDWRGLHQGIPTKALSMSFSAAAVPAIAYDQADADDVGLCSV